MSVDQHFPSNLAYMLMKVETTKGTDAAPDETNFLYTEEPSANTQTNTETRTGVSDNRPGWKPVSTNRVGEIGGSTEVRAVTVVDDNSRPQEHPVWVSAGFNFTTDTAGDPKRLIYTMTAVAELSVTVHWVMLNAVKDYGIRHRFAGCVFNPTLTIAKNTRWQLGFEGQGIPASDSPDPITGATIHTGLETSSENPQVGTGAKVSIYDTVDGLTYGGGTESAPLCEGFIDSLTINFNMTVIRRDGINCADGNGGRVEGRPGEEPATIDAVFEILKLSDFDFWKAQRDKHPIKVVVEQPSSAAGVSGTRFTCVATIGDFTLADNEGEQSATVQMHIIYADDGSGNFGNKAGALGTFEYFTVAP